MIVTYLRVLAHRLRRDRRGVAALEFALVLPMMLALYLGGFEACDAVSTYRKLADTTVTLGNVAAQYTSMSHTDVANVFAASSQIMAPYSTANLSITLSEVSTNASNVASVVWSQSYNGGTPLVTSTQVTLPSGMASPNTSYILVTTGYLFTLPTGYAFSHPLTMGDQIYMLPRQSASIPYTG